VKILVEVVLTVEEEDVEQGPYAGMALGTVVGVLRD